MAPAPASLVDLTIRDVAQLFGKRPSTVRAWVERGDFAGAYKLHGKEWRVPASAVQAFQDLQRHRAESPSRLSAWRSAAHRKATARPESGQQQVTKRSLRGNAED
jgi:excisionase family DNA binding protein